MDPPVHLLSLKVMRISRPSLASSWQPFFTSSPSFSAHATESLLSLQGKEPLTGHPKTLRDLTHVSQLLTLPSSFGAIQLGETFTSCLCVNNEATVEVEDVHLRIEMQTATSKLVLAEVGGPGQRLQATNVLEAIVSHEIKELGQHVLACQVSYRPPSPVRIPPGSTDDPADPSWQTFRKYYKFTVTNPLNVKTKVHVPRSPTALLSRSEREKIFLEIHVQNLTQESIWFERMRFECVDDWQVIDGNISRRDGKNLFSGSVAIMQPQDVRQYVYILTPTSPPSFSVVHAPGTIIPLGRLDLSWRSSFGEPGRLLTSLLTRRIPNPQIAPSALPPHIQRASTPLRSATRQHSPQPVLSRPSTPPGSPTPSRARPTSQQTGRPQSPALVVPPSPALESHPDLEFDLVVCSMPRGVDIRLEQPFKIGFELKVSGLLSPLPKTRLVRLLIQPLQPSSTPHPPPVTVQVPALPPVVTPRPSVEVRSPMPHQNHIHRRDPELVDHSPTMSPQRGAPLNSSLGPDQVYTGSLLMQSGHSLVGSTVEDSTAISSCTALRLPPPFPSSSSSSRGVLPLGASVIFLPPFALVRPAQSTPTQDTPDAAEPTNSFRVEAVQKFECTFVPIRKGFARVGALRILLVEDREIDSFEVEQTQESEPVFYSNADAKIVREWDGVAEVWVTS